MFQCGLPVPVDESSTIGIFKSVFLDIGDEQSLENDLSTYSAHLSNMNTFVKMADKNSLVLIDEFGTGTEPQFGAAIAESVLEELNKLNVFGLITTHYSNLKAFADKTLGMVNGAMAYDIDKLEPQYILEIGKPGSSYALEIAKKIGLSSAIIERSKQKIGSSQVDFDKLIRDLEADKNNLRKLISENEKQNTYLQKTTNEYQQLKDAAEANQKAILKEAKEKAKQLLQEANKKIETTIREIKENKADKELTKLLRTDLENFKEEITEVPMESPEIEVDDIEDAVLRKGDFVKVKDSGALGEIISLKDKEAVLSIGALQSNIKTSRLIKISKRTFRNAIGEEFLKTSESKPFSYMSKASTFSPTLDVRGLRGEEALIEVNQFMDNALILNAKDLKIIHGKGDGVLRTLIRGHLQHYKQVASILDEHADRGGAGATVVKLK
jgi:DNA mismatch repair protein MutS2